MTLFGSATWQVTADLVGQSGSLLGTTKVTVTDGWANFTDLKIAEQGQGNESTRVW